MQGERVAPHCPKSTHSARKVKDPGCCHPGSVTRAMVIHPRHALVVGPTRYCRGPTATQAYAPPAHLAQSGCWHPCGCGLGRQTSTRLPGYGMRSLASASFGVARTLRCPVSRIRCRSSGAQPTTPCSPRRSRDPADRRGTHHRCRRGSRPRRLGLRSPQAGPMLASSTCPDPSPSCPTAGRTKGICGCTSRARRVSLWTERSRLQAFMPRTLWSWATAARRCATSDDGWKQEGDRELPPC